jgi:flagellar basal-body rod modification protein FlgD
MDAASITGKSYGKWSYDSVENPKGKLEKDSFLKLFLTELKYQDPTEPMDNEKILTQTSQLTQLEAQEEQKKAMKKIVENFNKNSKFQAQYSLVPAIGKMARTTLDYVNINTGDKKSSFELYFDKPIKNGKIFIYYASSDTRLHVATTTVDRLVDYCMHTKPDGLRSATSVQTIIDLIDKNTNILTGNFTGGNL